jgi:glycine/D-amino acid oxidase-like deaminating enzyme
MKLTSDYPYWLLRNGLRYSYPALDGDISCDVVIVGGGITAAILVDRFSQEGLRTIVCDRRDLCTGSTSASTALLQYEIDVSLTEMTKMIGAEKASRAYRLSHASIDKLDKIATSLDLDVGFRRKTSIHLADNRRTALELAEEARARKQLGLDVTYHDAEDLKRSFRLEGAAALSTQQAASCDPYLLALALFQRSQKFGAQIYDRTEIQELLHDGGICKLTTDRGCTITSKHAIYANGYESQAMLREKIVNLDNTYALASEPLLDIQPWDVDWLLWEAKEPYLYLRITADNRLLAGGEDDEYHSPARRDRAIEKKSVRVEKKVRKLIPDLKWEPAYSWAGTFGKTKDGLAYIGPTPEYPGAHFALCFGGNGITFSAIAADILADLVSKGTSPDAELFAFSR